MTGKFFPPPTDPELRELFDWYVGYVLRERRLAERLAREMPPRSRIVRSEDAQTYLQSVN